jgi:predicted Zn-dependent protease
VRIDAARLLVAAPPEAWAPGERTVLADALGEYRRSQEMNADRVEAQLNLSNLEARLGNTAAAIERGRRAVDFAPDDPAPRINLADVLRRGDDNDNGEDAAERILREGLARQPASAELELALGLSLVRQGQTEQALAALERAYHHAPESIRVAYTYAIALQSAERAAEGVSVLARAHKRHPRDRELLYALATIERDLGHHAAALRWADALLGLDPADQRARALRSALERAAR